MRHLAILLALGLCAPATAQESGERQETRVGPGSETLGATTEAFLQEEGEALYTAACAGCHQPQGQGAVGAGIYPPLGANARLEGGQYPTWILMNGMGAMPSFRGWLTDDQVVEVVTYIQQNFGNDFSDHPTPDLVADLRAQAEERQSDEEDN